MKTRHERRVMRIEPRTGGDEPKKRARPGDGVLPEPLVIALTAVLFGVTLGR